MGAMFFSAFANSRGCRQHLVDSLSPKLFQSGITWRLAVDIWALSFQEPKSEIIITVSDHQSDFLCFSFKKDFKH